MITTVMVVVASVVSKLMVCEVERGGRASLGTPVFVDERIVIVDLGSRQALCRR